MQNDSESMHNCKFRLLQSNFSSLFMFLTRLSVGSSCISHGLGIIAETMILVKELDFIYICYEVFIIAHFFSYGTRRVDVICTD